MKKYIAPELTVTYFETEEIMDATPAPTYMPYALDESAGTLDAMDIYGGGDVKKTAGVNWVEAQ